MELKIWAKTFFSVYRILNKLASSIDKFVEIKAYSSFYTSIQNLPANNMIKVSEDLTCLINKKITLINIKLLTEKILANIGEEYARFIILRYIENKKFCDISEILHISMRTALRWNKSALEKSAKILDINLIWQGQGIDEKGIDQDSGNIIIEIDKRYFRPAEVDFLLGDYSKAKKN